MIVVGEMQDLQALVRLGLREAGIAATTELSGNLGGGTWAVEIRFPDAPNVVAVVNDEGLDGVLHRSAVNGCVYTDAQWLGEANNNEPFENCERDSLIELLAEMYSCAARAGRYLEGFTFVPPGSSRCAAETSR